MPTTFRPCQPDRDTLPPSNVRDWLPEGHLARHAGDLVDAGRVVAIGFRRCDGCETKVGRQLAGGVVLVRAIHGRRRVAGGFFQAAQEFAAFERIFSGTGVFALHRGCA